MADSSFPTGIDAAEAEVDLAAGTLDDIDGTGKLHSSWMRRVAHAIRQVQTKVGVDGSAVTSSHDYKLAQLAGVDALVGTASGALSGEIVVGTTPGGELGGTWASPTVDATHSGSSHAGVQAAAEATAAAALAAHESDTTGVHGITDTTALYRSGGTDVAVADGGTGASDASGARTNLGLGTIATQAASNVSITGGSVTGITDLAVADGGTGASDAATARTNLGLGSIATQSAASVSITGGSVTGITDLAVADGGTGASTASDARTNLGLGTIATQAASNVSITGGSITGITDLAVADGGTGSSTAAGARTNLGLVIGSDVASFNDPRFAVNRIASMRWWGHSWTTYTGSGDTNTARRAENVVSRLCSMLSVPPSEIEMMGRASAELCYETHALPYAGWPAIAQLELPLTRLGEGMSGSTPAAPYTARPGLRGFMYGLPDLANDTTPWHTSQRMLYRAWPHALRFAIVMARAGGVFDSAHSANTFSGFSTTTTSSATIGYQYRQSATNGDTVTHTIASDFQGGTVSFVFAAQKDIYTTLGAAITDTIGTSVTVASGTLISNNDIIQVDSEQMRVTAGGGTTSLTVARGVNSTTAATHSNGAVVTAGATTNVTWSGTAAHGSPAATTLAAQGARGTRVPVVKRFTGLTAADAGKTIIATVAGCVASSNDSVRFLGVVYEAPAPPPVLVCNTVKYGYNAFFGTTLVEAPIGALNTLTDSVVDEFDSAVAYVDLNTAWNTKTATLTASMNNTDTSTTVTVTEGTTQFAVGDIVRITDPTTNATVDTEDCLVTAVSSGSLTLTRGLLGTTKRNHASGHKVYLRTLMSDDNIHPSAEGARLNAITMRDALYAMTLSTNSLADGNGYARVDPLPIRSTGPLVARGPRGRLQITNGKATWLPVVVRRPVVVTGLAVNVLTAGSTGSVIRLGIRGDGQALFPDLLVTEAAATVSCTSTGRKLATVNRQFLVPGLYWLGAAGQGAPSTEPIVRSLLALEDEVRPPNLASPDGTFYGSGELWCAGSFTVDNEVNPQSTAVAFPVTMAVTPQNYEINIQRTSHTAGVPSTANDRGWSAGSISTTGFTFTSYLTQDAGHTFVYTVDCRMSASEFGKSAWTESSVTGAFASAAGSLTAGEGILVEMEYETVENDA